MFLGGFLEKDEMDDPAEGSVRYISMEEIDSILKVAKDAITSPGPLDRNWDRSSAAKRVEVSIAAKELATPTPIRNEITQSAAGDHSGAPLTPEENAMLRALMAQDLPRQLRSATKAQLQAEKDAAIRRDPSVTCSPIAENHDASSRITQQEMTAAPSAPQPAAAARRERTWGEESVEDNPTMQAPEDAIRGDDDQGGPFTVVQHRRRKGKGKGKTHVDQDHSTVEKTGNNGQKSHSAINDKSGDQQRISNSTKSKNSNSKGQQYSKTKKAESNNKPTPQRAPRQEEQHAPRGTGANAVALPPKPQRDPSSWIDTAIQSVDALITGKISGKVSVAKELESLKNLLLAGKNKEMPNRGMAAELQKLTSDVKDIKKMIHASTASVSAPAGTAGYSAAVRRGARANMAAAPPVPRVASELTRKRNAAASKDLADRSLHISMKAIPKSDPIHNMDPQQLCEKIRSAMRQHRDESSGIQAATRLERGDLKILFATSKQRDLAFDTRADWSPVFHEKASVPDLIKKYLIRVEIGQNAGPIGDDDRDSIMDANPNIFKTDMDRATFVSIRPQHANWKAKEGVAQPYIFCFSDDRIADLCILQKVCVNYSVVPARRYVPEPPRCFLCHQWGHTSEQCKAAKPTCGFCAGDHNTRDHPCSLAADKKCTEGRSCTHHGGFKCCHCKGKHPAWSMKDCPYNKEAKAQFEAKRQSVPDLFIQTSD